MSDPLGKPRSNSVLKTLPEETQSQIIEMLKKKGSSYRQVCERLHGAEWDIHTNTDSLRDFFSWWHMRQRFQNASERGRQLQEMLAADPSNSPEQIEAAGQAVFLNEAIETGDSKGFVAVSRLRLAKQAFEAEKDGFRAKLEQKEREIEQHERALNLAVQKFQFDAIAAAIKHAQEIKTISADRKLKPDQKAEQMRRLLFPQAFNPEAIAP